MGTIKEDLRSLVNEVLDRIDDIKEPSIRNAAILGVVGTLEDILNTLKEEGK